jgi:hypothetical protein
LLNPFFVNFIKCLFLSVTIKINLTSRIDLFIVSRYDVMTTRWGKRSLITTKKENINPFSSLLASGLHPLVAGGASAFITTALYQPLDFLKTQIQEPKPG